MNLNRVSWLVGALALVGGCIQELPAGLSLVSGGDTSPEPSTGSSQQAFAFRPDIQDDLDSLGCAVDSCHGGGALPMELVAAPHSDAEWEANYQQVSARARDLSSPMLAKATGEGGHIAPLAHDDPVLLRWRAWIEAGAPYQIDGTSEPPGVGGSSGAGGGSPSEGLSWSGDIGPLLSSQGCLACHGPTNVQGGYSLASYDAALGFGSDQVPNVIAGDATSLLVLRVEEGHGDIAYDDALTVLSWVVDWGAQP